MSKTESPWYKQPWAWFVLSPLILIVIVMSIMVTIAVRHADELISDDYQKQGMAYVEAAPAISMAHRADIVFDAAEKVIELTLTGSDGTLPDELVLSFSHPVSQDLDFTITLSALSYGFYQAELTTEPQHRWYLQLQPAINPDWRLKGEVDFASQRRITLNAAL